MLGLHKSLALPIVTLGLFCADHTKATMNALDNGLQTDLLFKQFDASKKFAATNVSADEMPHTEGTHFGFFCRNCQIVNKVINCYDVGNRTGLKNRLFCDLLRLFINQFEEESLCSWLRLCDCGQCRNKGWRCWKKIGMYTANESWKSTRTTTTIKQFFLFVWHCNVCTFFLVQRHLVW